MAFGGSSNLIESISSPHGALRKGQAKFRPKGTTRVVQTADFDAFFNVPRRIFEVITWISIASYLTFSYLLNLISFHSIPRIYP